MIVAMQTPQDTIAVPIATPVPRLDDAVMRRPGTRAEPEAAGDSTGSAPERAGRPSRRPARAMGDHEDRARVFIQLTAEQVDRVIDALIPAAGGPDGAGSAAAEPPARGSARGESAGGESAGGESQGVGPEGGASPEQRGARPNEDVQWIFRPLLQDKGLSQSLLIGLQVLTCFPLDGTARGVAEVAAQLEMNNSTVHRYMTTLLRIGLLERDPHTRWYRVARREGGEELA
jgi:IclR helix-turn-helix domain